MESSSFSLPLSPAPSPVPSIRRLSIRVDRPKSTADNREQGLIDLYRELNDDAKGRVLIKLLEESPREVLLEAKNVISPRLRHDPFRKLPLEISLRILSYITDPKSLAAAAQVSRLWYFLLSDDYTWKRMCQEHHYRRLSAAGSYVHKWNEFRERSMSQAIEESPEEENNRATETGSRNTAAHRNGSTASHESNLEWNSEDGGQSVDSRNLANSQLVWEQHHRNRSNARRNSLLGPRVAGDIMFNHVDFDPPLPSSRRASSATHSAAESNLTESNEESAESSGARRLEERRSSNDVRNQRVTDYPNVSLIHYGSRLPNFDTEMHRYLSFGADPSQDPIGEAYYDPEACITSPPDSYRSHFRQQYLLNQAWTHFGNLAGRYILPDHENAIVTTILMEDGYIVVALDTSLILVFSDDGKLLRSLYGHVMGVWTLALKGHTLISGGCDRDVREWNLQTGTCRKILRGHSSTVRCLAMVSQYLALSGGRDGIIRVWDLKDGKSLHRIEGHSASVRRLEVTKLDGKNIAVSASYDCTAKVWNIRNGQLLHTLAGHTNQIYSLAVDSGRIATGSLDHNICIWDLRTGTNISVLTGHSALVGQLAMKGSLLVSGGSDGSVRIWDLDNNTCTYRIAAHDHSITSLKLTNDRIITGGPDCRVNVWDARTGKHVRQLHKSTVSTVWGVAASDDRLLTVYSEGSSVVVELMSFVPY